MQAVGSLDYGTAGREHDIAECLRCAGTTEVMEGILSAKWMKLVSNCTTILTTSRLGLNLKEGEERPRMHEFILRAGQEAADVGDAAGYERLPILGLTKQDVAESTRIGETLLDQFLEESILRETKTGVLQDWEKNRKSEANDINGSAAEKAACLRINAPRTGQSRSLRGKLKSRRFSQIPTIWDFCCHLRNGV